MSGPPLDPSACSTTHVLLEYLFHEIVHAGNEGDGDHGDDHRDGFAAEYDPFGAANI